MITNTLIYCIIVYQKFISPFKVSSCRFYPSCSHYSIQSLEKHGLRKGFWYAVVRLAKCHPFHPGGFDPVK